jgi:hypothetical protein
VEGKPPRAKQQAGLDKYEVRSWDERRVNVRVVGIGTPG